MLSNRKLQLPMYSVVNCLSVRTKEKVMFPGAFNKQIILYIAAALCVIFLLSVCKNPVQIRVKY